MRAQICFIENSFRTSTVYAFAMSTFTKVSEIYEHWNTLGLRAAAENTFGTIIRITHTLVSGKVGSSQ